MATYQDLIDDHDRIDAAATCLLALIDVPNFDRAEVEHRLIDLAVLVGEHVAYESALLEKVQRVSLSPPWRAILEEGMPGMAVLAADWQDFLTDWNGGTIEQDPERFRIEARAILPRLRERVGQETRALYATALQTGVMTMRYVGM